MQKNVDHHTSPSFWKCFKKLPNPVQENAKKNFELLKSNPLHKSLRLKKVGKYWSVRIGIKYRSIAVEHENNLIWFWIGSHTEYDKLIK